MKHITLCLFLALVLTACSDSQQEKIDEINKKNAQKAVDYIQKPIDQAKEVQKMAEEKYKDFEKNKE